MTESPPLYTLPSLYMYVHTVSIFIVMAAQKLKI